MGKGRSGEGGDHALDRGADLEPSSDGGRQAGRRGALGGAYALTLGLAARVHRPVALVEILRAEGADVPLGTDELPARRADALEPRAACRAEDEVVLHALFAGGTDDPLLRFGEEAFLGELTLVRLAERPLGTHDEIKEETKDVEDHHHEAREVREDLVLGPLL